MAFPTSSLTNNQVHKEGNRAFVYDSALGVWDQVPETDRTENKILTGEIGSGVDVSLGNNTTFPDATSSFNAGHVVRTTKSHRLSTGGHVYVTTSSATASGIQLSTPATTGANYNIITWSSAGQSRANAQYIYLYCNKNSAGMAEITKFTHTAGVTDAYIFNCVFVDTEGLTAGTNVYEIYMSTSSGNFYLAHDSRPYSFMVQEIKV